MLAENQQVIVEVWLARRQIPYGSRVRNIQGPVGGVFANHFVVVSHKLKNEPVYKDSGGDRQSKLACLYQRLLGCAVGNVQDVGRTELHVFFLESHYFLKIDFHFMLLAGAVFADNHGTIGLGGTIQASGHRKQFQRGELRSIVGNCIAAGPTDGPENVDNSRVRNGNHVAGLQNDVVRHIPGFENLIQVDRDGVAQSRRRELRCIGARRSGGLANRFRGSGGRNRRSRGRRGRRIRRRSRVVAASWRGVLWADRGRLRSIGRCVRFPDA